MVQEPKSLLRVSGFRVLGLGLCHPALVALQIKKCDDPKVRVSIAK